MKKEREYQHIRHTFDPVYDEHSKVLILGTFPSVKSREENFYYGHPRNRFWKVLAALCDEASVPESTTDKIEFLLRHQIALWDVIAECDIIGSSDSSIRNVIPTDLAQILHRAPIQKIYANGGTAYALYQKYSLERVSMPIQKLPSTSPANAAFQMQRLLQAWREVGEALRA